MKHKPISKKFAIIFLLIINLFCLWLFWIGLSGIREIITSLQRCADVISVSSRAGFFIVVIGVPILCLLPIVEKVWASFSKDTIRLLISVLLLGLSSYLLPDFWDLLGSER